MGRIRITQLNLLFKIQKSARSTYEQIEKVLEVTTPELVEQRNRVTMMLEMISVATGRTPVVAPLQIQSLYDGLEGCVHFKDDNLVEQVVCFLCHD